MVLKQRGAVRFPWAECFRAHQLYGLYGSCDWFVCGIIVFVYFPMSPTSVWECSMEHTPYGKSLAHYFYVILLSEAHHGEPRLSASYLPNLLSSHWRPSAMISKGIWTQGRCKRGRTTGAGGSYACGAIAIRRFSNCSRYGGFKSCVGILHAMYTALVLYCTMLRHLTVKKRHEREENMYPRVWPLWYNKR